MTPLQRASVELQAACGEYHTVDDLVWLRGVLLRALAAERRRIRDAIRAELRAERAKWDALLRARDVGPDSPEALRLREDCARTCCGIEVALAAVRAPGRGR